MHGHVAESCPEELLDVFKAAALSVTKLYKTSTAAQTKARLDGYQDCLEDLLAVLDKGDADARSIRRWVVERMDGREPVLPTVESEDEVDKTDSGSTPEPQTADSRSRSGHPLHASQEATTPLGQQQNDTAMQTEREPSLPSARDAAPATAASTTRTTTRTTTATTTAETAGTAAATTTSTTTTRTGKSATTRAASDTLPRSKAAVGHASPATSSSEPESSPAQPVEVTVPMQDVFTFRSQVPYPTESFLELANLDLSDRRSGSTKDPLDASSAAASSSSSSSSSTSAASTFAAASSPTPPYNAASSRAMRVRHGHGAARSGSRAAAASRYSRNSAGQKRKLNFEEIFDLASLGYGKDVFGRGGSKRSRQA
ncbi:hypothetical protein SPI_01175 [Niveomyces insectorum RCEF 264]|uniref:Uncharacterized protein n=1 Tax=Niveomyces insectorum RCEF 264 TaxID=1081102 RepID=A0A167YR83_9HYPO|nr:hypothetical protein SPI_01175 [Niveomyces insectorum RCEF 264]